jgi:hypothetical protein
VKVTEPLGLLLPLPVTLAVSLTVASSPRGVPTIGAPPEFTTVLVQLFDAGQTVNGSQLPVEGG